MSASSIGTVQPKNSVRIHSCKNSLIDAIVKKIRDIPKFSQLKGDPELVSFIIEMVETGIEKDVKLKVELKDLVTEIMTQIFGQMTDAEKDALVKLIDFLQNNKQVQKDSKLSSCLGYVSSVLKKKPTS